MYRNIDPDAIVETSNALCNRISERFPGRGLSQVCIDVNQVVQESKAKAQWISQPQWPLRIFVGFLIFLMVFASVFAIVNLDLTTESFGIAELVQVIEAGINDVILLGAGVFFLVTLENRVKRSRALNAMHELRSLAHVIDMHQLKKDPERLLRNWASTESSPVQSMSMFELSRYLDYCSELLSIIGKVAALYIQNFDDPVVHASVNEIETLTTGLARKIWQKIIIIRTMDGENRVFL